MIPAVDAEATEAVVLDAAEDAVVVIKSFFLTFYLYIQLLLFYLCLVRLEDELKQTKPFKTEQQKLALNILFTGSWLHGVFSDMIKPFDITHHQFNVLRILKGKYPHSYRNSEITERMIDKASNVTRIVDKLQEKKLVTRTENDEDRRQVDIKITESGLKLLDEIDKKFSSRAIPFFEFNAEKAKIMNEWLDEFRG
jgi:DNA-binding MarR family transcriptional regulator